MKIINTAISGVLILESSLFKDDRGAFSRLFCSHELQTVLEKRQIVQINQSITHKKGAVRGMHYQHPPQAEMKIIRCLRGCVFDVVVDLRHGSPTFLEWCSVELSPDNHRAIVIPEGCAHGFQVLDAHSELLYFHTAYYTPKLEGAIRFDEPLVGINWPLEPTDISERDISHPYLQKKFSGVIL